MPDDSIVVLTGTHKGVSYPLLNEVTIGRNPINTIQTDDMLVSRRHAVVSRTPEGGARLRDLGSGNGTYIGKQRVLECLLADGDIIIVGSQQLQYQTRRPQTLRAADSNMVQPGGDGAFEPGETQKIHRALFRAPPEAAGAGEASMTTGPDCVLVDGKGKE